VTGTDRPDAIELDLDDIAELFEARAPDVLAGRGGAPAGIDRLVSRLALKPARAMWPDTLRIRLATPSADARPEMVSRAIGRWCEAELAAIEGRLELMARERVRAWVVGLAFFAFCLGVAGALEAAPMLSGFLATLLSETVIIAGWVGLWHPLDLTLYAWWPDARRRKLLQQLQALKLELG
jgi:hypothetical protein